MGVTRIYEKIEEGVKNQQAEISGVKRMVLNWAQSQALHHHTQEMSGQPHSSLGYRLAQKTVLKKVCQFILYRFLLICKNPQIHQALGFDEAAVNGFVIGGSAVSPETVRFLLSLDLKLLEVTSMTEMGGLPQLMNTVNPGEFRVGKVGLEFPELCDVKLSNKDEVSCHCDSMLIII